MTMDSEQLVTRDVRINDHRLTPHQMQDLHSLIKWLEGYQHAAEGRGRVPGYFELVMLYRILAGYQGK